MAHSRGRLLGTALLVLVLAVPALHADEGMWTFDNVPVHLIQQQYGFTPDQAWLDRVRLASVRFMDGGSGSFVSADGLVITNHHVGLDCIQNLSSEGNDYVVKGFLAPSRSQEPACPGYEVNVLLSIDDVTERVQEGITAATNDKQAAEVRKAAIAQLENQCHAKTGHRCEMVTLYQGAQYHLYTYKKYTDVRLVFAPEQQAAFFGGDPDNFTFPRHDLDIALFRAYENGRPAKPTAYLRWGTKGANDGDLVFVSGNPGSSERLLTMAQVEARRDATVPASLDYFRAREAALRAFSARGPEQARRAKAALFAVANSLKAYEGRIAALKDPKIIALLAEHEPDLRAKTASDPELVRVVDDALRQIAAVEKTAATRRYEPRFVGFRGSELLSIAGRTVQYVAEVGKPNDVRLEEFVDANLDSLRNELFSKAPIYADLEEATLAAQLEEARRRLGADHPFVRAALGSREPSDVARDAVAGTRLADVDVRKALVEGGPAAVAGSADSMVTLARVLDPAVRAARKWREEEVDAVLTRAGQKLSQARWKAYGKTVPPDATFTLRLNWGVVKGFPAEGTQVAPRTTFHGLYDRAVAFGNQPPWDLPQRFLDRKAQLDLTTPLNFVSTNDTIGGNSGSPVVNRDGEFVGIIFDGNIESLAWDYHFDETQGRTVSVDARGILEALRKVYDAGAIADELTGRRP